MFEQSVKTQRIHIPSFNAKPVERYNGYLSMFYVLYNFTVKPDGANSGIRYGNEPVARFPIFCVLCYTCISQNSPTLFKKMKLSKLAIQRRVKFPPSGATAYHGFSPESRISNCYPGIASPDVVHTDIGFCSRLGCPPAEGVHSNKRGLEVRCSS